jgi:peptide-methionine (S)-S-oxide reductase
MLAAFAMFAVAFSACTAQSQPPPFESPSVNASSTTSIATLGGGCFWCIEAVFQRLDGVTSVQSGYAGGTTANPTYKEVCSGTTGHAEVVRITFDPSVVSYADILQVFFLAHDPTTLNRQGNDVGTQYRSVIFTHSEEQDQIARAYIAQLDASKTWPDPIVTEVATCPTFYPAEDYHQNYFNTNGAQPYCAFVVRPKVEKFEKAFQSRLKPEYRSSK